MKVISVVGKKNTGKTWLTCKIIEELSKRGYHVASIKHSHHVKMKFDKKGTDTYRHKEAGSQFVIGSSENTFINTSSSYDLDQLLAIVKMMENPDYVVVEGFKTYPYANISTSDLSEFENGYDYNIKKVDALEMSDAEIPELVDLIEERSYGIVNTLDTDNCGHIDNKELANCIAKGEFENTNQETRDALLVIDGKIIPLNPFVKDFLKNSINGMIKSLKTEEYGVKDKKIVNILLENFKD